MLLSKAHDRSLRYCTAERNHSPETIKAYRQAIRRFLEWMKENGHGDLPVTEITSEIGRDYLYWTLALSGAIAGDAAQALQ